MSKQQPVKVVLETVERNQNAVLNERNRLVGRGLTGFYGVRTAEMRNRGAAIQLWHPESTTPIEISTDLFNCSLDDMAGIATAITLKGWRGKLSPSELRNKKFLVNIGPGLDMKNVWMVQNGKIRRPAIPAGATAIPTNMKRSMAFIDLYKEAERVRKTGVVVI